MNHHNLPTPAPDHAMSHAYSVAIAAYSKAAWDWGSGQ